MIEIVCENLPELFSGVKVSVEEKINGQFDTSYSQFFSFLTTIVQHKILQEQYILACNEYYSITAYVIDKSK